MYFSLFWLCNSLVRTLQFLQVQCPKNCNSVYVLAMDILKKTTQKLLQQSCRNFQYCRDDPICQKRKGTRFIWVFIVLWIGNRYISLQGAYFLPPACKLCSFAYLPIHSVRSIKGSILSICNQHILDGFYKTANVYEWM